MLLCIGDKLLEIYKTDIIKNNPDNQRSNVVLKSLMLYQATEWLYPHQILTEMSEIGWQEIVRIYQQSKNTHC